MEDGLRLENRHTGEVLVVRRANGPDGDFLELDGSVPPRGEGPPLHIHLAQEEEGLVVSGVLSTLVGGHRADFGPGETPVFPAGSIHRWWNSADQPLRVQGRVTPAVDLDRFLQATFAVLNAGEPNRPPLFYLAHVLHRHRRTQRMAVMPRFVLAVLMPTLVFFGRLLGKYRGDDWPGSPASCTGARAASSV